MKKHIRIRRGGKSTAVKTINIVPEDDGTTWARRSASSAASRSSVDSSSSTDSGASCERRLEVVHDMENEFDIEMLES